MKLIPRLKLWFCRKILGYIPAGHIVLFDPPDDPSGIQIRDPRRDPEIGRIGLTLGRRSYLRSPGFTVCGTIVLIEGIQYNLYTWDLRLLD